jgi:hypothetical protein
VKRPGLLGCGVYHHLYHRATYYLVRGAKPAELTVERPPWFDLVINTSKPPRHWLLRPAMQPRADELIK